MFSEAEPINTPQDIIQWFGRYTTLSCFLKQRSRRIHCGVWCCIFTEMALIYSLCWSCKSIFMLKQHLLHIQAWSKKSSILDARRYPCSALPPMERLWSSLLFIYNNGQKPWLGWTAPRADSGEHQGRCSSSPSSSKEGLGAWEQVSGSQASDSWLPAWCPNISSHCLPDWRNSFTWTAGPN